MARFNRPRALVGPWASRAAIARTSAASVSSGNTLSTRPSSKAALAVTSVELGGTDKAVGAKAALELGLVESVFPDETLAAEVRAIAARLAQGPTKALGLLKRAMNKAFDLSLDEALDYEAHLQEIAGQTADHREGVAAFLEKRAPVFL